MNWVETRLKHLCVDSGQYGLNVSAEMYSDSGTRLIRTSDITAGGALKDPATGVHVRTIVETRHQLHPGDLLLSRSGTLGRAFLVPDQADGHTFAGFLIRFRPKKGVDPRFLAYAAQSASFQGIVHSEAVTSTIQNFNADRYANIAMRAPALEEQRRIADFLDDETARIDRLRELHEHQRMLIKEAAFRRVFDAVRGTHVEGARKNSGLDWLGTVPADWRVGAVSHYFEVELGKMLNQERVQGDHLRPYLRVANVQWDRIDVDNLAMMDFPPEEQIRYRLQAGDLLVNEGGSWPGRAAVWSGEISDIYYQKALHRIRSRGEELPRWLYYCLVAAERLRVFQVQGNTSTMTHLTREQLRPQRFPFPELSTQRELVAQLDNGADREARFQRLLDRQLGLLAERRQALITAAVTGQFDVSTASGRNVTDGVPT
ncbi:restriction endonuclease subunit S [Streptomyces sp. AC512_CC834]|uniref:restriction endonuclease subunit S n=1 Tax=Streptomyces sp. AC512_CC834 TaxID=2823691 RepID=UPI0027E5179F|nr:restriction endonuclease subunit S [Streptomyces sp. AC512_CC834]